MTLRERGIHIDSVNVQKPSLDEVFMALTGHGAGDESTETSDNHAADRETAPTPPPRAGGHPMTATHHRPPRPCRGPVLPRQPARDRRPDHDPGLARHDEDAPQLRAALRRDHPAAAVHRDVRRHLRRRRLGQREQLPPGDHPRPGRADGDDRLRRDRCPAPRGHGQGRLRPLQGPPRSPGSRRWPARWSPTRSATRSRAR